ncbi:unnamed protein product (macronuclear) [Paramecium tetraurelia]|uniref:Uncharacterized protein n=1 Tax=Paramecium tetraurelia TaxID=5888 RepID=A0BU43_PARTE|nr:uncharacterized protein GSPATT00032292001 [Paramecium tetraurelia]CAK62060.1 unnamed protein product [Paramecium tetraurelia]|eukprot:XP_001429458.1 hypothetical protein (macronuclear) [Paramecium tetraurelia strain d4-2]
MCDNETLSEGMNESILKRYGYVDFQTKQQTLEDDKLKSLKVIQKLQLNSNSNGDTPRMKRFVYKSLIKKEDKSQQKYQESQLENLHQEFIQFKKRRIQISLTNTQNFLTFIKIKILVKFSIISKNNSIANLENNFIVKLDWERLK